MTAATQGTQQIPLEMVNRFRPQEWKTFSDFAGLKNPPSEETQAQFKQRLAEYEAAQSISAAVATPTEAQAAFERARSIRTQPQSSTAAYTQAALAEPPARVQSMEQTQQVLRQMRERSEQAVAADRALEASTRVERIIQYLRAQGYTRRHIAALRKTSDWELVGRAAGGNPPTAEEIQQIRNAL